MKSYRTAIAGALCAFALSAAAAAADPFPGLPAAPTVSDNALARIRGMYVPPPANTGAPRPLAYRDAIAPAPLRLTQSAERGVSAAALNSPFEHVGSGQGTVTYFGVTMVSSWTQPGESGAQGDSVGVSIGFDLEHGGVTISAGSSSTNGGLSTAPGNGTISGSATNNLSSGIGQNIQVAGNGNTVSNAAAITVNGSQNAIIVPTANTCGSQCTISYGLNGVHIGINTAQGTVLQSIGPNGVLQSAQIDSDMNTIQNQLGVNVKVAAPTFGAGSILPILQTLQGLP